MNTTCPPGTICINHFNAFGIITIILIILYVTNKESYSRLYSKINFLQNNNNTQDLIQKEVQEQVRVQVQAQEQAQEQTQEQAQEHQHEDNRRLLDNALYPPLSRNPHDKGIPINIETRESGGDFQQIGILSKKTVSNVADQPGNNNDTVIVPLYGKPLYRGARNWLYYTETDKAKSVKIPLVINNRDCTDDRGCDELNDGDSITITSLNGDFDVKLYKFNKPRYIPFI